MGVFKKSVVRVPAEGCGEAEKLEPQGAQRNTGESLLLLLRQTIAGIVNLKNEPRCFPSGVGAGSARRGQPVRVLRLRTGSPIASGVSSPVREPTGAFRSPPGSSRGFPGPVHWTAAAP